jgi:hypothetical protein
MRITYVAWYSMFKYKYLFILRLPWINYIGCILIYLYIYIYLQIQLNMLKCLDKISHLMRTFCFKTFQHGRCVTHASNLGPVEAICNHALIKKQHDFLKPRFAQWSKSCGGLEEFDPSNRMIPFSATEFPTAAHPRFPFALLSFTGSGPFNRPWALFSFMNAWGLGFCSAITSQLSVCNMIPENAAYRWYNQLRLEHTKGLCVTALLHVSWFMFHMVSAAFRCENTPIWPKRHTMH